MEVYKYTIQNVAGQITRGEIQGHNKDDAISRLLKEGYTILRLKRKYINLVDKPLYQSYSSKIRMLIVMVNQLNVMTSSGLTLVNSVHSMAEHTDDRRMKKILNNLYFNLYYGNSMQDSLDPKVFPKFFIHIIGIGETSGNLEEALSSLSLYYSKDLAFYHKIKNILAYPFILLLTSIITLLFTTNFLVPNFIVFLEDGMSSLPWYSRVLLGFSASLQNLWSIILILILTSLLLLIKRSHWIIGNTYVSLIQLNFPIVGKLKIKRTLLKFFKNLEVILSSGSNLSHGINFLLQQHNCPVFRKTLYNIQSEITKGGKFSEALSLEKNYFSPLIVNMVAAGEKSGNLNFVLGNITEYLQEDLDHKTKRFVALLEPGLIVLMSLFVGGILISIMVPLFSSYGFMV